MTKFQTFIDEGQVDMVVKVKGLYLTEKAFPPIYINWKPMYMHEVLIAIIFP